MTKATPMARRAYMKMFSSGCLYLKKGKCVLPGPFSVSSPNDNLPIFPEPFKNVFFGM